MYDRPRRGRRDASLNSRDTEDKIDDIGNLAEAAVGITSCPKARYCEIGNTTRCRQDLLLRGTALLQTHRCIMFLVEACSGRVASTPALLGDGAVWRNERRRRTQAQATGKEGRPLHRVAVSRGVKSEEQS